MRNYGQFCPIARGSEVVAERWTPIIVRSILLGCQTFNEIAAGAPGRSRALLTRRLHELEHAGVIQFRPKPDGHGSLYKPTPVGNDLLPVLLALGRWAERWMGMSPTPMWSCGRGARSSWAASCCPIGGSWSASTSRFLATGPGVWMLIERREVELCRVDPGFGDDLVVTINAPLTFARWHVGLVDWAHQAPADLPGHGGRRARPVRRCYRSSRLTSTVSTTEATTENNTMNRQPSPPPSGRTSTFPKRMPLD
jgi:DNA-binding HxlR family transcriptional regulator